MNQLTLPTLTAGAPQRWSIRHVGDPHSKLEQAKETLTRAVRYKEIFENTVTQLASVHVDREVATKILERVLPDRPKRPEQVESIVRTFLTADTVGFHDNGWGIVNAVSDYFQWGRTSATRTQQSEFTSALDGDTAKAVNRTAQLVLTRA
jgi:hypothetical protein